MLAEAEANRIRIVAVADTERMKSEAALLKESPLLINKIVAERMSDKLQIMMVPSDAKIFFNDVLKSGVTPEPSPMPRLHRPRRKRMKAPTRKTNNLRRPRSRLPATNGGR